MPLSSRMLDTLSRTALPFAEAQPLPRHAFTSPAFFELDRRLFARAWIPVAHESELRAPGQFRAADLAGERVLVVRGADHELRAFLDRCAHRGTPLTEGEGGSLPALVLVCPYHGLRYDLTGRADPSSAPSLGYRAPIQLPDVRIAHFQGFVLATLSPDTPPLDEWMGPVPPWLARASTRALRLGRRQTHDVLANWKLCAQNFQESHHFPSVHPSLQALTPWTRSTSDVFGGRWLGGTMEIVDQADTVSRDGRLAGRPPVAHPEDARLVRDALLFPGWMTSLQPDYFLSYRLIPRAPDRTTIIADILFHEGASDADRAAVYEFWDRTNAEDRAICERQQRGVASPSFVPGPYARSEDGQHAFDRLAAEAYLALAREDDTHEEAHPYDAREEAHPYDAREQKASQAPMTAADRSPRARRAPIIGLFGKPYVDLGHLLDDAALAEMDAEITRGLVRANPSYTGGSLKWMGVVAPWQMEDDYLDLMHVIERLSREELMDLLALGEPGQSPGAVPENATLQFGDETDHPLNLAQMKWLSYRHGVYFPWKVCLHLLENDRWEDKHSGAGKDFTDEAKSLFPRTLERIATLPFSEIGRVVIFGLEPNDHAPLHRDTEPKKALTVAHSISIDPRGTKRFYLNNHPDDEPLVVDARVYWFNDMDYHGVLADPFFRYSLRIDGVLTPSFLRDVERIARKRWK